jgi:hypothetical protein
MSSLVEHARRELDILANKKGAEPDYLLDEVLVKCVEVFASYGHSGGSVSWAIPVLSELLQFKNLSPLTTNPDEWMQVTDGGLLYRGYDVWQNRRNSEAFSHDHGITYYLLSEGASDHNPWPRHKSEPHAKRIPEGK